MLPLYHDGYRDELARQAVAILDRARFGLEPTRRKPRPADYDLPVLDVAHMEVDFTWRKMDLLDCTIHLIADTQEANQLYACCDNGFGYVNYEAAFAALPYVRFDTYQIAKDCPEDVNPEWWHSRQRAWYRLTHGTFLTPFPEGLSWRLLAHGPWSEVEEAPELELEYHSSQYSRRADAVARRLLGRFDSEVDDRGTYGRMFEQQKAEVEASLQEVTPDDVHSSLRAQIR